MTIELVDQDAYAQLTPQEKMLQRLQGLSEVLLASDLEPISPETLVAASERVTVMISTSFADDPAQFIVLGDDPKSRLARRRLLKQRKGRRPLVIEGVKL